MSGLWEELSACFQHVLGGTDVQRKAAEAHLDQLAHREEYAVALTQAIVSAGVDEQTRQLACMTLKKYVTEHWTENESNFKPPVAPDQVKQVVRDSLPPALNDPNRKIRAGVAYVISKIAQWDWPEQWPGLFGVLLAGVQSQDPKSNDGAMRVFEELVKDMSDTHLEQLVPALFPELLRLYSDGKTAVATRMRAMAVFRTVILLAANTERHAAVQQSVAQWIPLIAETVRADHAPLALRAVAAQAAGSIVKHFAKTHQPAVRQVLVPSAWAALSGSAGGYVENVVNGMDEAEYDDDGEQIGLSPFVAALIEFVCDVVTQSLFKKDVRDGLPLLLRHVMVYMQLTDDQLDSWENDANKFIADDEEDSMTYSVRNACVDLLHTVAEEMPKSTVKAVFSAAQHILDQAAGQRAAALEHWWKGSEACLLAIGHVSNEFVEQNIDIDINTIMRNVYTQHLQSDGAPYLQGRALWLAGRYSDVLAADVSTMYLDATAKALEPHFPVPVRILAMRAFQKSCESVSDKGLVRPHLPALFQMLATLLPSATEDLLVLVLETMVVAVGVDTDVTAAAEPLLGPLVIDTWLKYGNDPTILMTVQEVLMQMAQTAALGSLLQRALVPIVSVLRAPPSSDAYGMQASAIDLLATLVRGCPAPLPAPLIDDAFPALMHVLSQTDDAGAMQNGCECLSMYLIAGSDQLAHVNGIDQIFNFVARLMQTGSEDAAIFIGRLITKLIRKVQLGPVLGPLLRAALEKLVTVQYLLYEQTLVCVFAQLLVLDLQWTLDFVAAQQVGPQGEHNGLTVLLSVWMDNQKDFSGRYDVNTTMVAIGKLLQSRDMRVANVMVKGERVVSASEVGTIRTRSRAKQMAEQYTTVPAPNKMLQIMVEELLSRLANDDEESWDEEEDEDEDDGDGAALRDQHKPTLPKRSVFAPAEEFAYLDELLQTGVALDGDEDDDAFEDPEIKADPIYTMDAKEHIDKFLRTLCAEDPALFAQLAQTLPADEQAFLHEHLAGPA